MSACEQLTAKASLGAAPALRAVDCLANEAAASAFGRLFGGAGGGALLPALTLALTLYIAFFAISLLTGRSRLGISALTPHMLTLGLVLTFATSWAAYQSVVWNLAVGAPDQLAGVLIGAPGASGGSSATVLFADRLDMVFAAIAQAGELAGGGQDAAQAAQGAAQGGSFTPPNLMWLGALLLLLGTVGVLVTARIALAVLLALGPVFVVFALFSGTRGLFAGWLRGVVMTAITPLFVVLGGGLILELLVPVLANLVTETGISGQAAMALFLIASVHVALMAMVLKVTGAIVSGWQVFGAGAGSERDAQRSMAEIAAAPAIAGMAAQAQQAAAPALSRSAAFASATGAPALSGEAAPGASSSLRHGRSAIAPAAGGGAPALPPLARQRARGIGSRFAARPSQSREMLR